MAKAKSFQKNKWVAMSLLAVLSLGAMKVGEELELDSFLNARESGDFLSTTHNVRFVLPTGAKMVVQKVKTFDSGNYGLLVKLTSEPHKGETAWVYYDVKKPALKILSEESKPAEGKPKPQAQESQPAPKVVTPPKPVQPPISQSKSKTIQPKPEASQAKSVPPKSVPKEQDKVVATKPVEAVQKQVIEGPNKISTSKIDLASALACQNALNRTHIWAAGLPTQYGTVINFKMQNGNAVPSAVMIYNQDTIHTFPAGTSLFGDTKDQADKIFANGTAKLDDTTRGAVAEDLRGSIQNMTRYVASYQKAPYADEIDYPPVSPQEALAALDVCGHVKDEPAITAAAASVSASITKTMSIPAGAAPKGKNAGSAN